MPLLSSLLPQLAGFVVDTFRLSVWLVLLVVIFVPLERLFSLRPCGFLRPQVGNDLIYYFLNSLLPAAIIGLPLGALAMLGREIMPAAFHQALQQLPLWLSITAGLIIGDIGSYWGHRLSHEIPLLWRFHAVHHSAEHIDFLVNVRGHPIDMVVTRMFGLAPLYILGLAHAGPSGSMPAIVIAFSGTLLSFFLHANIRLRFGPLEGLIATPAFHHWHHSCTDHINHNYAATFPWIDRVFGTYHLPRHFPTAYGTRTPVPATLIGQLLSPLNGTELRRPSKAERPDNGPLQPQNKKPSR
jgi:sterol desaturase/sphingolipid hydroxylase (fatty acid hydroxylase superfamily)